MGALTWEGLLGSAVLVILAIVGLLALVSMVTGIPLFFLASGVEAVRGASLPDFGSFMAVVGSGVVIAFFAAISAK